MALQEMVHNMSKQKEVNVYQLSSRNSVHAHGNEDEIRRLHWTFGILGILGFAFNIFVIIRLLLQDIRRVHLSKLYIFSLAVSDLLFGGTCFLYILFVEGVVEIKDVRPLSIWFVLMGGLSFTCSLLTIILITADRFLATTYPFIHKVKVTRTKVLVSILIVWIVSMFVTSTQYWIHKMVLDWVVVLAGISASFGLTVTYIHIARVARRRNKNKNNNNDVTKNSTSDNTKGISVKSLNTTYLGFFITMTFIGCNLPFSITTIIYMEERWHATVAHVIFILLSINTVMDPLIYTAVEIVNKVLNKRRRTHQFRSAVVINIVNQTYEA